MRIHHWLRRAGAALILAALSACTATGPSAPALKSTKDNTSLDAGSAPAYLRPFYARLKVDLPSAGILKDLPRPDAVLTRIAFGSCNKETQPIPALAQAAKAQADLFVYLGDTVYADNVSGDPTLPELRQAYRDLANAPEFAQLRASTPIIATWDDHDYGWNDAGGAFYGKEFAEKLFENFWHSPADARAHPGVYQSSIYGPIGKRVQIIVLDTRFFRSGLKWRELEGGRGRAYLDNVDDGVTLLGEAQWKWLEQELQRPAEIRLIASSIQVLPTAHRYEKWSNFSKDRQRLSALLRDKKVNGAIVISGDRHVAGFYRSNDFGAFPLVEMTASALNRSTRSVVDETDPLQIGTLFGPNNFSLVDIDWDQRQIHLQIRDENDVTQREMTVALADLGTARP